MTPDDEIEGSFDGGFHFTVQEKKFFDAPRKYVNAVFEISFDLAYLIIARRLS